MTDQTNQLMRDLSPPRKIAQAARSKKEKVWLSSSYEKPFTLPGYNCLDDTKEFERIIWEYPTNRMLPEYDHTPAEMAVLCGEGSGGWLLSSHISWILEKVNEKQDSVINLCFNFCTPDDLRYHSQRKGENMERLNFVMSVEKNVDGSVYISTSKKSGNHWVLVSVDLSSNPTVLYCDSLGWECPDNLLDCLLDYTQVFGVSKLDRVVMMHVPSALSQSHKCTTNCRNYPLQSCSNVSGLVAVICAVVSALDKSLFHDFCGLTSNRIFLHNPTKYEKYLRRVVISWFLSGTVDTVFLKDPQHDSATSGSFDDHLYCVGETKLSYGRKRKLDTPNQQPENVKTACTTDDRMKSPQKTVEMTENAALPADSEVHAEVKKARKWVCQLCDITFTLKQSLYRHRKNKHRGVKFENTNKPNCHCTLCSFKTNTILDLIKHYKIEHKKGMEICEKIFQSDEDFNCWKKEIEKQTSSHFVLRNGSSKLCESIVKYYYCDRSGKKMVKDNPQRRGRGTKKMDNYCTAFMIVNKNLENKSLSVQYCLEHHSHSSELCHLNLSQELRGKIVGQLHKQVKSKIFNQRKEIRNIHKNSETVAGVREISGTEWLVPSDPGSNKLIKYSVYETMPLTCKDCQLVCSICQVCVHRYTCTCPGFLLKGLSCKHIHAVHMFRKKNEKSEEGTNMESECEQVGASENSQSEKIKETERLKELALRKTNDIVSLIHFTNDNDTIKTILEGLQKTYTLASGVK